MANDTTPVISEERHQQHHQNGTLSSSPEESKRWKNQVYMNGHGHHRAENGHSTEKVQQNGDKKYEDKRGDSLPSAASDDPCDDNDDDELKKLNSESESLTGSELVRQKSATLTPTSGTESDNSGSNSFKRSFSPVGQNAFMYNARNNLRRSFTLPRGLLLRKSGQTGPASENQNGNFVRNIFLTLVRSKSVRKKPQGVITENGVNAGPEAQPSCNKLQGGCYNFSSLGRISGSGL